MMDSMRLARGEDGSVVVEVGVDDEGAIAFRGLKLSQREAINVALALTYAVEKSIYRNQLGTPGFHSAERIHDRANTKLGRAIHALRRVYP